MMLGSLSGWMEHWSETGMCFILLWPTCYSNDCRILIFLTTDLSHGATTSPVVTGSAWDIQMITTYSGTIFNVTATYPLV